jgi:hypothetical protein
VCVTSKASNLQKKNPIANPLKPIGQYPNNSLDPIIPICYNTTMRKRQCRIKDGWGDAGKRGTYFTRVSALQEWAVVLWDGDEDPSLFKLAGLEMEQLFLFRNGI